MKILFFIAVSALSLLAEKMNIALLDLKPISVDAQHAQILTNKLRSDLINTGGINVLERNEMEAILEEQEFQQTGCTALECTIEIGYLLGVTHIVSGTVSSINELYYVNATLTNIETGTIEKSVDEYITKDITEVLLVGMPKVAKKLVFDEVVSDSLIGLDVELQSNKLRSKRVSRIIKTVGVTCFISGMVAGLFNNSKIDDYHQTYSEVDWYDKQHVLNSQRESIEEAKRTRNIFYGVAGTGLMSFAVTLFF